MNELLIEVTGLPPAKSEAWSMLGARHPHRARVLRLLEVAHAAMAASGFSPFDAGDSIGMELLVRCHRDGHARGDATNYLGGIGDVLQSQRTNADVSHLGDLAAISVYPDDKQIHEVHCMVLDDLNESYAIRLWRREFQVRPIATLGELRAG